MGAARENLGRGLAITPTTRSSEGVGMKGASAVAAVSIVILIMVAFALGWIPPRGPALRAAENMEEFADRMEGIRSAEELRPVVAKMQALFDRGYSAWVEYRNLPEEKRRGLSPELQERVGDARLRFKRQEARFRELRGP
jgi:hypothetical protein